MKNANQTWTKKDMQTIKTRHNDGLSDQLIAEELGRSVEAIKSRRCAMGLKKNDAKKRGPKPTPKEDAKFTSYQAQPRKTVRYLWGALEVTKF
tara:strand:+ start:318 stop:596 length:279 start_codon:yes stop_codon:yes gene_type:complete